MKFETLSSKFEILIVTKFRHVGLSFKHNLDMCIIRYNHYMLKFSEIKKSIAKVKI